MTCSNCDGLVQTKLALKELAYATVNFNYV
jgi:hypothetical protein